MYSRTSIIRPSIIRNFGMAIFSKMDVSTAVTMDTGMFIFCACADTHIHCCLSIQWVEQGVVYPFNYPAYSAIRPALEPRCPRFYCIALFQEATII